MEINSFSTKMCEIKMISQLYVYIKYWRSNNGMVHWVTFYGHIEWFINPTCHFFVGKSFGVSIVKKLLLLLFIEWKVVKIFISLVNICFNITLTQRYLLDFQIIKCLLQITSVYKIVRILILIHYPEMYSGEREINILRHKNHRLTTICKICP